MDPDLDGDSDGVDIDYLVKVLANKYRFLASFSSTALPFTPSSTIRTSSSALASVAQTSVLFEIGTTMNTAAAISFGRGTNLASSPDGVVVSGEVDGSSPGVFAIEATDVPYNESSVGVVVLIRTENANGDTGASRQFSFYCSRLVTSCRSVYGDNANAFRPMKHVPMVAFSYTPSAHPLHAPSLLPTPEQTASPVLKPTREPTALPTPEPTPQGTVEYAESDEYAENSSAEDSAPSSASSSLVAAVRTTVVLVGMAADHTVTSCSAPTNR